MERFKALGELLLLLLQFLGLMFKKNIGTAIVGGALFGLWYVGAVESTTLQILFGFVVGLYTFVFVTTLVMAFVLIPTGTFVNKPGVDAPSGIHFFTKIEPGQVKVIIRGKVMRRMVMNTAGKRFARVGDYNDESYWEIVDGRSESPLADMSWVIRPWAWIIFKYTGAVFTGIYPFQRVREYKLERTTIVRSEGDGTETTGSGRKRASNIVLGVKTDYSDHFRLRDFLFPMHIRGAESKDKIPLDVLGVATMACTNPHLAAYGNDRWDQAATNMVTDKITNTTKATALDDILTSSSADTNTISAAVKSIGEDTKRIGMEISGFDTLEINPDLDPEGLKDIQAEARAIQKAKAEKVLGEAAAGRVRAMNKAVADGGDTGAEAMRIEGQIRAAEAAGKAGGTIIMNAGGSGNVDPVQAEMLRVLKELNNKGK